MKQCNLIVDLSYFRKCDGNAMDLQQRIDELFKTETVVTLKDNNKIYSSNDRCQFLFDILSLINALDRHETTIPKIRNRSNILPKPLFGVLILLVIFVIPVILNVLLQKNVGVYVIGGKESSVIWLGFWGTYLSTIGTVVMAWVSLQQNRNIAKRDERNREFDKACESYAELERFIKEQEKLYTASRFCKIGEAKKAGDILAYIDIKLSFRQELQMSSTSFMRFMDNSDKDIMSYGIILCHFNQAYVKCLERIASEFTKITIERGDVDEIIGRNIDMLNEELKKSDHLLEKGFDLLVSKRLKLLELKHE